MPDFKYILQPYKGLHTRYDCPQCGKRKKLSRYIDTVTGEQLAPHIGRCSREINCGYHYTPRQYFEAAPRSYTLSLSGTPKEREVLRKQVSKPNPNSKFQTPNSIKPNSYIPPDIFKRSLQGYEKNHFATYLRGLLGKYTANWAIGRYYIGTSAHWDGATVFWQVDTAGRIRTGKIMLYSPATGKRIKEPYNHITWVHSVLKLPECHLKQCLFGEYLLSAEPDKPVAIVESEKTAVIASACMQQYIWLACGSLTNLTAERCKVLQHRNVTLYPDLNAFEKWSHKAKELTGIARFVVSDLLERNATGAERAQGLDLADYLVGMIRGRVAA